MNMKKIARRERAAARFTVTPRSSFGVVPTPEEYEKYLERKVVEAKALGLVPAKATVSSAIHMLG